MFNENPMSLAPSGAEIGLHLKSRHGASNEGACLILAQEGARNLGFSLNIDIHGVLVRFLEVLKL